MKKSLLTVGSAAALLVVIAGCSSVNWEKIGYVSPTNGANLKANPSIRIVSAGDQAMMAPIVRTVIAAFKKSGQFKFDAETPDYWIILNGARKFRADDSKAIPFNREVKKVARKTGSGGQEVIQTADYNSSTATALLSVAIYSVKDLAPVYYFDVALYDADFKGGAVRGADDYDSMFKQQIIRKVKDSFLVQKRKVETALPKNADAGMKKSLLAGNVKAVEQRASAIIHQSFDAFIKDVVAGKYKDKSEELEIKLSNYYILALAQELGSVDPGTLKKLHAQHAAILNQTKADGLTIACPNSLARIESKLKLMQALK